MPLPSSSTAARADARLERYPGAKAGAGVYQAIINAMPPHAVYCEPFVGSGQVFLRKRPAPSSIVVDADADVALHWQSIARNVGEVLTAIHGDARSIIASYGERIHSGWLIYADPPYVRSTRRQGAPLYRHELSDQDHLELLALLRSLPARVMLSGYRCALYDQILDDWRRIDFPTMTRGGPAVESLWCNFAPVANRHEFTYLGDNYRERERIKRKQARWRARLAAMPAVERRAMLAELAALELASPSAPVAAADVDHHQAERCAPADTAAAGDDQLALFDDARSRTAAPADAADRH